MPKGQAGSGIFGHSRLSENGRKFRILPGLSAFIALVLVSFGPQAPAEIADWDMVVRPLEDGVPQVAVMRLRNILKRPLDPADHKIALAKLGEALLAAEEPE